jgi:hypothetical protein
MKKPDQGANPSRASLATEVVLDLNSDQEASLPAAGNQAGASPQAERIKKPDGVWIPSSLGPSWESEATGLSTSHAAKLGQQEYAIRGRFLATIGRSK